MRKIKNMEEFAAVSGISRPTVSKYFNNPDSVRASTRARIEDALATYDYRPNIFAINQNRRLTKNVGIVVPNLSDPFFAEIARTIEHRCIALGYSPIVFSAHGKPEREVEVLDNLRTLKPAGALVAPRGRTSDKEALQEFCHDVPTVLFDSFLEGVGAAFVGSNNQQSIGLIVEYLCRTGEPPCLFQMEHAPNPNARRRHAAYVAAMERLGHVPHVFQASGSGWDFEEIGYAEGKRAFASRAFETNTILCSNDRLAIGMLAAAYEVGLRVGRGHGHAIRIAGHDDHPFSRFTCPPLTTVSQDYTAIAERSVEELFGVIDADGGARPYEQTFFDGQLIMRESA